MSKIEKTLEGNIKIAEFLGFMRAKLILDNDDQKTIETGFMLSEEFASHAVYSDRSNFCRVGDLRFHNSWLWLSYVAGVLLQPSAVRKDDYEIFEDCVKAIDKIRVQKKEKLFTKDEVIKGMRQAWGQGFISRGTYNSPQSSFAEVISRFFND